MNSLQTKTSLLTEEQLQKAPKENYMNPEQLDFFKKRLLELYEVTKLRIQDAKDQMARPIDDSSDPSDRASWEERSSIALKIVDREQNLLPKISISLERINQSTYGYCLESDEPIGIPRLLARPTAEYCAEIKAIQELKEKRYR